jgi:hypothetical protein
MSKKNTRNIRQAKGSLQQIMENIGPYLPSPDVRAEEPAKKWGLPETTRFRIAKKKRSHAACQD